MTTLISAAVREALALIHAGDKARAVDALRVSVQAQARLESIR